MAERGLRRTRVGVVVSDKMNRSVVVEVRRTVQHRFYLKFIQKRSKFLAHDENDQYRVGDKVRIIETRPLSKRKRWRVQEKIT